MIPQTDPASLPLRDIHLPDAISWWPLAPGWWLLGFLLIVLIGAIIFFIRQRRNYQLSTIFLARQELEKIRNDFNLNQDKTSLVQGLSGLVRRISISLFSRTETASLTGREWLLFLDQFTDKQQFSRGAGQILVEAPYQASSDYDSAELLQLVTLWIDRIEKRGKTK
ncbi:MAG: DUF4381 domain-containing protein [Proteobacteria bacterium]|nr:DUF4381 domain-containing protein [Pseudomonadota bacterium]